MKGLTAKYGFDRLMDFAPAAPVAVAKHGRPVIVVMAVEEVEHLKGYDPTVGQPQPRTRRITTTQ